jgi:hypothetical protein
MRLRDLPWMMAAALALTAQAAPSASVRTWIGREPQIEAHLRTAQVTRIENLGTGVTRPRRVFLEPAVPVGSLTWKVLPPGRRGGYWESYKSEIAAYELDRRLGMQMVPPAVEREIDGDTGAAVMWVEETRSVKELGGQVPSGPEWGAAIRRMLLFDDLIGNPDRNAGNILVGAPGELVLIDHSRAFVTETKLPRRLERVDGDLWDRMQALTADELTHTLEPWMDRKALAAVLERRRRMAADIETLIRKKGRDVVIIR